MATIQTHTGKEHTFEWQGIDRYGKPVHGSNRAASEKQLQWVLRRQGIQTSKIGQRPPRWGKSILSKDLSIFTRQLATLIKAGVPLLQSIDILSNGSPNPSLARLLRDLHTDIETGTSLSAAFAKHPRYFSPLYCNLIEAGEMAGILDLLLDRLAVYLEKTEAIKSKMKSALMYPASVLVVALLVTAMMMIFVVPTFKEVFLNFGAELPAPTRAVMAASEFVVAYGWLVFGGLLGAVYAFIQSWKRHANMQYMTDRILLKLPIFGPLIEKSCNARWTRTLGTLYAAGVPLIEALNSVGGAAGNRVYARATDTIQQAISQGKSLSWAMRQTQRFPAMVLQMCAIGEESGSLDHMLGKAADFYEAEVDDMVAGISSLMEPIIIVILGLVIGGIVVAMYLPIFKLGQVV